MRLVSIVLHIGIFGLAYLVFSPPIAEFVRESELLSVLASGGLYILGSFLVGLLGILIVVGGAAVTGGLAGGKDGLIIGTCLGILLYIIVSLFIDVAVIMNLPAYFSFAPQFTEGQAWVIAVIGTLASLLSLQGNSSKSSSS